MLWKLRKAQQIGSAALRAALFTGCDQAPLNGDTPVNSDGNPLRAYFESHHSGRGIWKWEHYFDVYHRHLAKFVGTNVNVLEVGIFSGGSLGMWREYFGAQSHIYGVDIEDACKVYEDNSTTVHIGDQQDRAFWQDFKRKVPSLHVVIDDGGHQPEQQIVTLEETLPHLEPGGVFICEDIHGEFNDFCSYATGLVHKLNRMECLPSDRSKEICVKASPFQQNITSIHFYPFAVVIEKAQSSSPMLRAPRHGTQWQPFL
jgi:hypothetical protein